MPRKKIATNKQILKNVEAVGSSGDDQYFCFTIDNGVFHIHVTGGRSAGISEPDDMLANLIDYKKISIEIWDHKEVPPGDFSMEPLIVPADAIGNNYPAYTFTFNVRVFPHEPVAVRYDERFKSQKWSKEFKGSKALVSPKTVCDILKYCEKISLLKVFW